MSLRDPSIAEIVRAALDARVADLRVSLPGAIESFDPETQLASVRPLLHDTHEDEAGDEVTEELPVIPNVPVQVYGAGELRLSFPVNPGDPCLLVFTDRSLDLWIERGGSVDPVDVRRHNLTDAVAFVGVRAKAGALADYDTDAAALRHADGTGVYVQSGRVDLGVKNASMSVALAEKVLTELSTLKTELAALVALYNTHVHPVTTPPPASAPLGVAIVTTMLATAPTPAQSVASSVVKCAE